MFNRRIIKGNYVVFDSSPEEKADFIVQEAIEKAKNIEEVAQQRANDIIDAAKNEAEKIIIEAEKKEKEIIENAYKKAEEIISQEKIRFNKEYIKKLEDAMNEMKIIFQKEVESFSNILFELTKIVLKKILQKELEESPQWLDILKNRLFEEIELLDKVVLRISPLAQEKYDLLLQELSNNDKVEIITDSSLEDIELKMETKLGTLIFSRSKLIDEIIKSLEDTYSAY